MCTPRVWVYYYLWLLTGGVIINADRIPGVFAILKSQRVSGIWGRNEISWQVIHSIIVSHFKELFFRCHCSVEVSKRIKNLGVKTKSGHRYETQLPCLSRSVHFSISAIWARHPMLYFNIPRTKKCSIAMCYQSVYENLHKGELSISDFGKKKVGI